MQKKNDRVRSQFALHRHIKDMLFRLASDNDRSATVVVQELIKKEYRRVYGLATAQKVGKAKVTR